MTGARQLAAGHQLPLDRTDQAAERRTGEGAVGFQAVIPLLPEPTCKGPSNMREQTGPSGKHNSKQRGKKLLQSQQELEELVSIP